MKHATLFGALIAVACAASLPNPLRADEPTVSYIFPAGGQRGTTTPVIVGGHYLHDAPRWEMLGNDVSIAEPLRRAPRTVWFEGPVIPLPDSQRKEDYPADYQGRLTIAADAPFGFHRWQVATSQGASVSLPFVVGDLPEVVEQEMDGDPIPTRVNLPITINGRIFPRQDVDVWTFDARAGEAYTCEVMAARLGSPLDSRLTVVDPEGVEIAESVDRLGNDSWLRFRARRDGVHQVRIHDTDCDGLQHYVYRLTIANGARVDHVYPLGGRRGESVRLTLTGQNLPNERREVEVAIPVDAPEQMAWQFSSELESGLRSANPVWLETSDLAELLEAEPNDSAASAPIVDGSAVLNGRIAAPGDVDVWRFTAAKGERLEFEVRAARLGSPLDAVIEIRDTAGKSLANADDIAGGQTDARLSFTAPTDGEFSVNVRDQFDSRGDGRFAYRLYLRRSDRIEPSFTLNLPADALTVNRGGEAKLKITAERLHGFAGAIRLTVQDLPEGVKAEEVEITDKKNDATILFKATADARVDQHRLKILGRAEWEDRQLETVATTAATTLGDPAMDRLWLAVAMPTPFQVIGDFETKYAARGSTYVRHFRLERGDYAGPLTVRLAERQVRHLQGVSGPTINVPADANEFDYPIHLPPWMEIGRTSRTCVMAVGTVKDEQGRDHTVSYTSHAQNDQIIVLVDPGQLAVRLERTSILAAPGGEVLLPIQVERGQDLAGPVRVELLIPPHIAGLTSPAIELASEESAAQLSLTFDAPKCGPFNQPLIVRATGSRDGLPYTAEAELEIVE